MNFLSLVKKGSKSHFHVRPTMAKNNADVINEGPLAPYCPSDLTCDGSLTVSTWTVPQLSPACFLKGTVMMLTWDKNFIFYTRAMFTWLHNLKILNGGLFWKIV